MKIVINADDFGLSPGVNQAIINGHINGCLTHTSILVNADYFKVGLEELNIKTPSLKTGLHFNLTTGKAITPSEKIPLLVNENGYFKLTFLNIFFQCYLFKSHAFIQQVKMELEAQIRKALKYNLTLSHIDGHRHIHVIPGIYSLVQELAKSYKIPRIRIIQEPIPFLDKSAPFSYKWNGGLIKLLILKLFNKINEECDSCYRFMSILNTCKLSPVHFRSGIPKEKKITLLEINLHPGNPAIDQFIEIPDKKVKKHLLSPYRKTELEVCYFLKKFIP